MPGRYRCNACGNVTRFDVVATRRTKAFHHYTIGGDLEVEDVEMLEERIEQVTCRWCNAQAETINDNPGVASPEFRVSDARRGAVSEANWPESRA